MSYFSVKEGWREGTNFETAYSEYTKSKITKLAKNMFKWTISEKNITGPLIEKYLWEYSIALVWRHPDIGWIVTGATATKFNINGMPKAFRPVKDYEVSINFPEEITLDDPTYTPIPIYEWHELDFSRKMCLFLCNEIADVNETIRQQVWNQKTPLIAMTGSSTSKDKTKSMIVNIAKNMNALFVDSDIVSNIKPLDLNAPFNIEQLHQHKQLIFNSMLEWLGIDNRDVISKKERMIVDEQEANDEILNYVLADQLNSRLEAIDLMAIHGITATVEIQRGVRPEDNNMDGDPEQPGGNNGTDN